MASNWQMGRGCLTLGGSLAHTLAPKEASGDCLAHSFGLGGSFCQDGAEEDGVTGWACAYGTDCTDPSGARPRCA